MKTIEQGLDEAYENAGSNAYFGDGFHAGVNFCQRWIPVSESLPDNWKVVLVRGDGYSPIRSVALYKDGVFEVDFILEHEDVTHWRQIDFI